jgi:hypothetical protein
MKRTRQTIAGRVRQAPTIQEAREIARYGEIEPLLHKLAIACSVDAPSAEVMNAERELSAAFTRTVIARRTQDLRDLADFLDRTRNRTPDKMRLALLDSPQISPMTLKEFALRNHYKGSLDYLGRVARQLGVKFRGMHWFAAGDNGG